MFNTYYIICNIAINTVINSVGRYHPFLVVIIYLVATVSKNKL